MTIRKLIQLSALALILLLTIGGIVAVRDINMIRLGGPLETEQRKFLHLGGDAMPPPLFIVRPYLEMTLAIDEPDRMNFHIDNIDTLKTEYEERKRYWLTHDLPSKMRQELNTALAESDKVFAIAEQQLIPALRRGDIAAARYVHDKLMAPHYRQHRATMDNVVTELNAATNEIEQQGKDTLSGVILVLSILGVMILAGVGAFAWMMLTRVSTPLARTAETMRAMVSGDLSVAIEGDTRSDEMGDVARALVSFRQAEVDKRALEELSRQQQAERTRIIDALSVGCVTSPTAMSAIVSKTSSRASTKSCGRTSTLPSPRWAAPCAPCRKRRRPSASAPARSRRPPTTCRSAPSNRRPRWRRRPPR